MTSQPSAHMPPERLRRVGEPFAEVAMGEQHRRVKHDPRQPRSVRAVLAAASDMASAAVLAELDRRRRA